MGVRGYAIRGHTAGGHLLISSCPLPSPARPRLRPATLSEALFKTCFYAVIAALAVAPLALRGAPSIQGWYSRMLASRPMVWLGEISYEIFLIHLITMEFAMD